MTMMMRNWRLPFKRLWNSRRNSRVFFNDAIAAG
jgi:hypothetical protein